MRIKLAIPDALVTPAVIEAALEATTLANEQAIARGEVPSVRDAIADGVRWRPEPFLDGEHFDLLDQVIKRGWGDCDDLAPALTADLRASGEDPGARTRIYQTGKDRYHAVTETSDGEILDPSKWAGMGRGKVAGVGGGAITRPFAHAHAGALCVVPHGDRWWARADLPWQDALGHLASHARARTPEAALDRAIAGAIECGSAIESPLVDRMREAGALLFSDRDAVQEMFGEYGARYVGEDRDWKKVDPIVIARYALRDRVRRNHGYQLGEFKLAKAEDVAGVPDQDVMVFWDSLSKEKRSGFRSKWEDSGKGLFGKIADAANPVDVFKGKGPLGAVINPVQAGLRAAAPSGVKRAMDRQMESQLKGASNLIAPGTGTLLSSLAGGKGTAKLPGTVPDGRGGVSVPLPLHPSPSGDRPTLYYHPAGSIGPVIMRF